MSIVIYARVSTGVQTLEQQIESCRNLVPEGVEPIILSETRRGWDYDGAPAYTQLTSLCAQAGKISEVIVFKLDRLGRSAREIYNFVCDCRDHNIRVRSVADHCDTSTGMGMLVVSIYASMAEMERETMSARIRAKLDHMKEEYGYRGHGSPSGTFTKKVIQKEKAIRILAANGVGAYSIGKQLGIDYRVIKRVLAKEEGTLQTREEYIRSNPHWYETPEEQRERFYASQSGQEKHKDKKAKKAK